MLDEDSVRTVSDFVYDSANSCMKFDYSIVGGSDPYALPDGDSADAQIATVPIEQDGQFLLHVGVRFEKLF